MESRSADNEVPALIAVVRITPANRRLDRFGRNAKRFVRLKLRVSGSVPVCVAQFQRQSQYSVAKIQKIRVNVVELKRSGTPSGTTPLVQTIPRASPNARSRPLASG